MKKQQKKNRREKKKEIVGDWGERRKGKRPSRETVPESILEVVALSFLRKKEKTCQGSIPPPLKGSTG